MSARPRIIILGAGFGGLQAAQQFAGQSVDVLLVDRNNFHTFTPLLYQVATCALDPGDIAYPIRTIFRRATNIHFLMGEVQAINPSQKTVLIKVNGQQRTEVYDFLIVAVGTITNYFNIQALRKHAFGLKDLRDAVRLRNHILRQFEKAAWTQSPTEREARTTFVVVGGGPTGIETAGALFELYNHVLRKEYSAHPHMKARVILLEATNTLLAPYPDRLRQSALAQLQSLGVEVWLNARVADASHNQVTLADGRVIQSYTLVWAAGVRTTPLIETINVVLAAGGRIPVNEYLQVPEYPDIYAVGDIAYLLDENNQPYPQLIPVANQQGALAAKNILQRLRGHAQNAFRYKDRGIMATIGRSRAVAWVYYRVQLSGWLAWQAWLWFHLIVLIGFRNRLMVLLSWVWNYLTYDRSVRIILDMQPSRTEEQEDGQ